MKRKILYILIMIFFSASVFAQESAEDAQTNSTKEITVQVPTYGFSVGIEVCSMGFSPSVSMHLKKFELLTNFYFSNSKVSPKLSLGYNTNPFESGNQHFIGFAFLAPDAFSTSDPISQTNGGLFEKYIIGPVYRFSYLTKLGLSASLSIIIPFSKDFVVSTLGTLSLGIRYTF